MPAITIMRCLDMENAVTLDNAIDTASRLPPEQQAMLVEILRRRHLEARRLEIATEARQAIAMFRDGILKPQSVAEAIADLHRASVGEE